MGCVGSCKPKRWVAAVPRASSLPIPNPFRETVGSPLKRCLCGFSVACRGALMGVPSMCGLAPSQSIDGSGIEWHGEPQTVGSPLQLWTWSNSRSSDLEFAPSFCSFEAIPRPFEKTVGSPLQQLPWEFRGNTNLEYSASVPFSRHFEQTSQKR